MKTFCTSAAALVLLITMLGPSRLQAQQAHRHSRYKLIDLGTFGGPQSYLSVPSISYAQVLNNHGTVTGWADTSMRDPFPDVCFDEDCFVARGLQARENGRRGLKPLTPGFSSQGSWISQNGLVAGVAENGETDPLVPGFPQLRGVLWQNQAIVDLGTLEGGYQSLATSVNSHGQVAGFFTNNIPDPDSMFGLGYQTRAFLWQNGIMQDLGTLGTGTNAMALLINERGQVAGNSYTSSQHSDQCAQDELGSLTTGAFLWEAGKITDLGNFGGSCTFAFALNNRGQVSGGSRLPGDQMSHPYLWTDGKIVDLGTFGGGLGTGLSLNDSGTVAGWATYAGDNVFHAALWTDTRIMDLGVVGTDASSFAFSINSKGQVIGISVGADGDFSRAKTFLWEDGGPIVDVASLISGGTSWQLFSPANINDDGDISGNALDVDGNQHAFLLVPCGNEAGLESCNEAVGGTSAPATKLLPVTPSYANETLRRIRPAGIQSGAPGVLRYPLTKTGDSSGKTHTQACTRCCNQCSTLTLTPSSITFAAQKVGTRSSPKIVSVFNGGPGTARFTSISISGPFVETHTCGGQLPPRTGCQVKVGFTPNQLGSASGTLTLIDSAENSPQSVSLSGTGD